VNRKPLRTSTLAISETAIRLAGDPEICCPARLQLEIRRNWKLASPQVRMHRIGANLKTLRDDLPALQAPELASLDRDSTPSE